MLKSFSLPRTLLATSATFAATLAVGLPAALAAGPSGTTLAAMPGQSASSVFTPSGCKTASCEITATVTVTDAVVVAPGVTAPGLLTTAGTAASASVTTYRYTSSTQECSGVPLVGCDAWHFGSTVQWYGQSGVKVWSDDIDCNSNLGGIGFNVSVSSCGFTNSPSYPPNPINAHDEVLVSAIAKGVPISDAHGIYWDLWSDGKVSASYN